MEEKKKMTLTQLTVIVAVNMMGSGIIMLPANMARVGAISLLSWGVTAVGSMAIAYGFAQAGLFNQRPGGMSLCRRSSWKTWLLHDVLSLFLLIGNWECGDCNFCSGIPGNVFSLALIDADRYLHRGDRADLVNNRG
jgi:putrescine:ornithine antiporter